MDNKNICKNCLFWQPNGGLLGFGYCLANKMTYRKHTQSCKKFEESDYGEVWKANMQLFERGLAKNRED